jgi:hypothetical protein
MVKLEVVYVKVRRDILARGRRDGSPCAGSGIAPYEQCVETTTRSKKGRHASTEH